MLSILDTCLQMLQDDMSSCEHIVCNMSRFNYEIALPCRIVSLVISAAMDMVVVALLLSHGSIHVTDVGF